MSSVGIGVDYDQPPDWMLDPDGEPPPQDQPDFKRTWCPADLSDVLDGTWKAPEPTVGRRTDNVGLFYPGKCHTIASESEAGKTWLALSACGDEISDGNHVIYLDFEDDRGPVVNRLLSLGADADAILERFHYIRPESPLSAVPNGSDIADVFQQYQPTLVILDGVTEAMTLHGLNPLDNADCAKFGRMLPRRMADLGAAVASLDHLTKSSEGRGRYAIGAVHKLNSLDGAAYLLENRTALGIGLVGRTTISIAKDRPGQLRRHALPRSGSHWFADLVVDATDGDETCIQVGIRPPDAEAGTDKKPTYLMAKVAAALGEHGTMSQRQIIAVVGGKRDYVIKALSLLQVEGYVSNKTPHELLKPYGDDRDS